MIKVETRRFVICKALGKDLRETVRAYGSNVQVGTLNDQRCLKPSIIARAESELHLCGYDIRRLHPSTAVFDPYAW